MAPIIVMRAEGLRTTIAADGQQTPAQRAAQLAEVAAQVYDQGAAGIRLPLDAKHPLVHTLSAAVKRKQVRAVILQPSKS